MGNLEKEFNKFINNALRATLNYARHEWISDAQQNLRSTREDYISGLQGVTITENNKGYIELKGSFPTMIEEGYSSFDMKMGFANSPKKKETPMGWYLTIPFRHMTASKIYPTMPKNVFKEAKKLSTGDRLTEALVRDLGYKPETSWAGYEWKNSMYDSLTRIVKEYSSGKTHGHYTTFRRVSNKTDTNAWMHPGYQGLKALDRVAPKVEDFFYDYIRG